MAVAAPNIIPICSAGTPLNSKSAGRNGEAAPNAAYKRAKSSTNGPTLARRGLIVLLCGCALMSAKAGRGRDH